VVAIRQKMGTEDKNLAARVGNLARALRQCRPLCDSVPLWQDNLASMRRSPVRIASRCGQSRQSGIVYLNQTDIDQAEPLLRRSAAIYLKAGGETNPQYVATQDRLPRSISAARSSSSRSSKPTRRPIKASSF